MDEAERDLLKLLRAGQVLLMKYPVAARAAVRAFVAEGRRYAETEEGRKTREQLAGSALLRNGRVVWDGVALDRLDEGGEAMLPSVLLEAVIGAAASARMESLMLQLLVEDGDERRP